MGTHRPPHVVRRARMEAEVAVLKRRVENDEYWLRINEAEADHRRSRLSRCRARLARLSSAMLELDEAPAPRPSSSSSGSRAARRNETDSLIDFFRGGRS